MDQIAQAEYGVSIAYENVVRCRGKDPQYCVKLREYYPQMKFVLDVKQAVRAGRDPMEYVRALGNSIVHVHISDSDAEKDCLPVGSGTMDLQNLMECLMKEGFCGNVLQEVYRESYEKEEEVLLGYRNLEQLISTL